MEKYRAISYRLTKMDDYIMNTKRGIIQDDPAMIDRAIMDMKIMTLQLSNKLEEIKRGNNNG